MAVDSLVVSADGKDRHFECRMHLTKSFVWASAGMFRQVLGPFDVRTIATSSLRDDADSDAAVGEVRRRFSAEFEAARKAFIAQGANEHTAHTDMIIIGAKFPLRVALLRASDKPVSLLVCPSAACSSTGITVLGEHSPLNTTLDGEPAIWKRLGLEGAVRELMRQQEAATPKFVAGPVSIIRVDAHGASWIDPGLC